MTFSETTETLGSEQAKGIEEILHRALVKFFGPNYGTQDLQQRAQLQSYPGGPSTFLVLDGIRVLQWWPPEFTTRREGDKSVAILTTKYRHLSP